MAGKGATAGALPALFTRCTMATHGSGSAFPTAALVCAMRAEATRLGIDPDLGEPDMLAESFAGDLPPPTHTHT